MEWRTIKDFPKYEVSWTGQVRNTKNNKPLLPIDNGRGYLRVGLYGEGKTARLIYVHRLVAAAFIDNPSNLLTVNHIDGIKSNNNVWNLEWSSYGDNISHSYKTGLRDHCPKTNHLFAVAKTSKKVLNESSGEVFSSVSEAARKNNLNAGTLSSWLTNKRTNRSPLKFL